MLQERRVTRGARTLVPACMAAVAYVDPGNFGVNVDAGAQFGYSLVWVVVLASGTAAVVQYLAAKLGLATGLSLAENCRAHCSRPMRIVLWLMTELVVIMTDLAELVGGAFALNLLFGVPMFAGALIVGAFSFVVLAIRVRGRSGLEGVILALLGTVVVAMLWQVAIVGVEPAGLLGSVAPHPMQAPEALLAVGIVGATIMPHALHFHSAVSRPRSPLRVTAAWTRPSAVGGPAAHTSRERVRSIRRGVGLAMSLAGVANVSIMAAAATLPHTAAGDLSVAFHEFGTTAGRLAEILFGVALLASGFASTLVGVYTGQVVMQGFLYRTFSVWVRRCVSLVPPLVILGAGLDASRALVLSQVVLSFALPTSLIPLIVFTRRRSVMGDLTNGRGTTAFAVAATAVIVALDAYILLGLL